MNQPPFIIDADVHNDLRRESDLFPFLAKSFVEEIKFSGMPIAFAPYRSPVGVQRRDAVTPAGGAAGSDP